LLIAAGLSGFGLAMRTPDGSVAASTEEKARPERVTVPTDPRPAAGRTRPAHEAKVEASDRSPRTATRVTDLPPATEGVQPAAPSLAAAAKPAEAVPERQEPPAEAVNAAPASDVPSAAEVPEPAPAIAAEPGASNPPSTAGNAAAAAALANSAAIPNGVAGQPAAILPAPPSPAPRAKGDFNTQAAREALEDAAGRAGKCRNIDAPTGTARIAVTFAPNGLATNAVIESGPFVGTAAGTCVASKFRAAKVPPFSGESVIVRKSVLF
jgi:hypothetical protein